MYKINVSIKGIAPLLINAFSDQKSGKKSKDEYTEEALNKLHRTDDGDCCVTSEMVKASLITGASMAGIKLGRKSITQYLKAAVFVEPRNITLGTKEPDLIDKRMGRIPPGPRGAAVMLYRPLFNEGWEVSFSFLVSHDIILEKDLKLALSEAGILAGIGAGRPDFGRFEITKWQSEKIK
jgi:hypothetical protein